MADDFVLVAMKGDDWRAMTCIDDLTCEELAHVLLEWQPVPGGNLAEDAVVEIEPLYSAATLSAQEAEIERLHAEANAVSAAIGSPRFMDPPDGGSVTLAEQVERMRHALESAEAEVARLRKERDDWKDMFEQAKQKHGYCIVRGNELADKLSAAEANLAEARARLETVEAETRERCAILGYAICAETRHVTLGDKVAQAIRNLEPRK